MNWLELAESIKVKLKIESDKEFALYIGISAQAYSKIKAGKNDFSQFNKLILLDKLGFIKLKEALKIAGLEKIDSGIENLIKKRIDNINKQSGDESL